MKHTILRFYLLIMGIVLLFWWPLSHFFYSDWYHSLLGFPPGSYDPVFVQIIGACGFMPVLLALFSARDPEKNKGMIIILIFFSLFMGAQYLAFINSAYMPVGEYINVAICFVNTLVLTLLYPDGILANAFTRKH